MIKDWSETEFLERVHARVRQLGKPESRLLKDADGTGDEIRKVPKHGRQVATLVIIARALRWTLGQAMGTQDPTAFFDRELEVDPRKLTLALSIAEELLRDEKPRTAADLANATSRIYSVFADREARGLPLDDAEARALIESLMRRLLAK